MYAIAEAWLISRSCPSGAIPTPAVHRAADDATRALEARVREAGSRFALLTSYTDDQRTEPETAVVLRARDPQERPEFRVLLESYDRWTGTHTLREGGFATREAAAEWWGACRSPPPAPAVTWSPRRRNPVHRPCVSGLIHGGELRKRAQYT
ncbi:lichenysin synthetase A [Streptomyces laurentii]|uniref:Lichenysin synthetase A n=1 Tax=Streptomyces laurentii TaxID=39478 RepID=A0A160P7U0_STRLU|nr:lichenysin synthetase A [Streptomyces laurentii]